MDLKKYDGKHVRITDKWGETFAGMAEYGNSSFLECEYGGEEDGIFIEDCLIYNSQIVAIEEVEVHGTVELWTERMILRRYRPEDADDLYRYLGTDPAMYAYSGWNPYATLEMARETVRGFIDSYDDERAYSWIMDIDDVIVGTIGAYDYKDDQIEVGFSVVKGWQGRGLATAALKKVLEYLTENESIPCVKAWCAAENIGSQKVLEKAGMKFIRTEKNALTVGERVYDKLTYEYRADSGNDTRLRETDIYAKNRRKRERNNEARQRTKPQAERSSLYPGGASGAWPGSAVCHATDSCDVCHQYGPDRYHSGSGESGADRS